MYIRARECGGGDSLLFRPSIGVPIDRTANYTDRVSPRTIVVSDSRQIFGLMIANYSFCGQLRGVIDRNADKARVRTRFFRTLKRS